MKTNTFWKGLFMTIVAFLSTALATGLPSTSVAWWCLGITILGTAISYSVQHVVFPSGSILGHISIADFFKGLGVAVGSGLSAWAASAITSTTMDWKSLGVLMGSVLIGFIAKTFSSDASGQLTTGK